jgi:hypothetical protein
MKIEEALLEEIVKNKDITMNPQGDQAVILDETCRRIGRQSYEIRYEIQVKNKTREEDTIEKQRIRVVSKINDAENQQTAITTDYKDSGTLRRKSIFREIALAEREPIDIDDIIMSDTEFMDLIMGRKDSDRTKVYKRKSYVMFMNKFLDSFYVHDEENKKNVPKVEKKEEKSTKYQKKEKESEKNIVMKEKSRTLLPYEKEILSNICFDNMKRFNIDEIVKLGRNLEFPSDIVVQCIGKEYINIKQGDKLGIFKILYNMNKTFQNGIIMPVDNYDIILYMAEFMNYKIMGFLDHFQRKETIQLKYDGCGKFKIMSDTDKPFMEGLKMDLEFKASDDFYILLTRLEDVRL